MHTPHSMHVNAVDVTGLNALAVQGAHSLTCCCEVCKAARVHLARVVAAGDGMERAGMDGFALDGGVALEAALDGVHLRHLVEDDVQDLLAHLLDARLEHLRDLLERGGLPCTCLLP
jgi:hypothetical protein